MLRIGEDYSPHISKIIIAQVMALNQQTSIFTLKIISKYWYLYFTYRTKFQIIVIIRYKLIHYQLQFSEGLDQIYNGTIPSGKFSILEPEVNGTVSNILNIYYSHMLTPRFIKKSSSNNTNAVS